MEEENEIIVTDEDKIHLYLGFGGKVCPFLQWLFFLEPASLFCSLISSGHPFIKIRVDENFRK